MLDSESSLRLKLLRFPLIVGVVFVHAYGSTVELSVGEIGVPQLHFVVDFIRDFISQGLARLAVPVFFVMSGYLFFVGFEWSVGRYFGKLKSRVRTLLVPFLFWNATTLATLALIEALPAAQPFLSGKNVRIAEFSGFDYLNALIGINRNPIAYPFWFIKDLMVVLLLVPLIQLANKYVALPFLLALLVIWVAGVWPLSVPSVDALLYFSAGAAVASRGKSLFALDALAPALAIVYLLVLTVNLLLANPSLTPSLNKLAAVLGVPVVLFCTQFVGKNELLKASLLRLSGASFFVYAVHEPGLAILKKVLYKLFSPSTSFAILALYFLVPILIISLAVVAYDLLEKVAPRFLRAVTGGR